MEDKLSRWLSRFKPEFLWSAARNAEDELLAVVKPFAQLEVLERYATGNWPRRTHEISRGHQE